MLFQRSYFFALCTICFISATATVLSDMQPPETKRYTISESSKLYLSGTTNVNLFTCDCEDRWVAQSIQVENGGAYSRFRNARLSMMTRKFDCHNAKMDRDMHKALKAESYPAIQIELLETWYDPEQAKQAKKDWFDVKAKVKVTITGVTRIQFIEAKAKATTQNHFALKGEKALKMTEFGIDPPEALFGLIKVNDQITFHFDLGIQVEDEVD